MTMGPRPKSLRTGALRKLCAQNSVRKAGASRLELGFRAWRACSDCPTEPGRPGLCKDRSLENPMNN